MSETATQWQVFHADERPVFRVGPEGVRRITPLGNEIHLGDFDGETFIPDPSPRVTLRLDRPPPPTPEELAEMEAANNERRERNILWSACRERELRGETPGFSAWANEKVIHLSYTPFCAFPSTGCGIRIKADWQTAVGIQDMHRGRVCKRCAWNVGRSVAKSMNIEQPSCKEYFTYKKRLARPEKCPGSGFQAIPAANKAVYLRNHRPDQFPCPDCGRELTPRLNGMLRVHIPTAAAGEGK